MSHHRKHVVQRGVSEVSTARSIWIRCKHVLRVVPVSEESDMLVGALMRSVARRYIKDDPLLAALLRGPLAFRRA